MAPYPPGLLSPALAAVYMFSHLIYSIFTSDGETEAERVEQGHMVSQAESQDSNPLPRHSGAGLSDTTLPALKRDWQGQVPSRGAQAPCRTCTIRVLGCT